MGAFEDRIVASLVLLHDADPDCGRPMFVLPCSLMTTDDCWQDGTPTRRHGEVLMVCRPEVAERSDG